MAGQVEPWRPYLAQQGLLEGLQATMEYASTLLDVLRALPVDARAEVFGETFSRRLAGCRLACRELQQLHDSSITHVRLQPPAQQQPGLASPLAKFVRCSRLDVRGASYHYDPMTCALAGTTPEAMARITHLAVSGYASDQRHFAEAVVARLPCLEELKLAWNAGVTRHKQPDGICSPLGAGMSALQRLTLERVTGTDVAGLGALAACPRLRELALGKVSASCSAASARAALEGLAQLQRLERLTLAGSFFQRRRGGRLLTKLLVSHRPTQLRTLVLLGFIDAVRQEPVLEVGFTPGIGVDDDVAEAAAASSPGIMSCVQLFMEETKHNEPLLVSALLAAADSLQQQSIPKLLIRNQWNAWELAGSGLWPEAALPRLLARCTLVDLERLPSDITSDRPAEVLSAVRLMGLPRVLELKHGALPCRDAALGTSDTAEMAAAAAATDAAARGPGGRELGLMLQQLDLLGGTGGGHGICGAAGTAASFSGAAQLLQLDTASPEEVLREAVERLWAEAALASGAEAAAAAGGGAAIVADRSGGREGAAGSSSGIGGCGGGGGGYGMHPLPPGLLLLRSTLPPAPERSGRFADMGDASWRDWLEDMLHSGFAAPGAAGSQPAVTPEAPGPALACEELPLRVYSYTLDSMHVAAPAAGMLLLKCRSEADAATLAAMVPAAAEGATRRFSAIQVPPDAGRSSERILESQVLQVLKDLWARSGAAGATSSGGAGGGGGSGGGSSSDGSSSIGDPAPAPLCGGSRVSEEALGLLQRLLELDRDVRELWSNIEFTDGSSSGHSYGYYSDDDYYRYGFKDFDDDSDYCTTTPNDSYC